MQNGSSNQITEVLEAGMLKHPSPRSAMANSVSTNNTFAMLFQMIATDGVDLPCKQGCSFCCHLRVTMYQHEAVAIYYKLVSTLSSSELKKLRETISINAKEVARLGEEQHFQTNIQCAMLSKQGSCTIYSHRPLACAGYHSMSKESCEESYNEPTNMEHSKPEVMDVRLYHAQMEEGISTALTNKNFYPEKIELHQALNALFDSPILIQSWAKGRKII